MSIAFIGALVALAVWIILVCVVAVTAGTVHILFAIGVTLLIRWWALRS